MKANERIAIAIISNNDEHIFTKFRREEFHYPQLKEALMDHKLTSLRKLASRIDKNTSLQVQQKEKTKLSKKSKFDNLKTV